MNMDDLLRDIALWGVDDLAQLDFFFEQGGATLGRKSPEGIGHALWSKMHEIRNVFTDWLRKDPMGELVIDEPTLSRKQQYIIVDEHGKFVRKGGTKSKAVKALKPGQQLREEAIEQKIEGGPYIELARPYPLKMKPSKSYPEGVKPITKVSFFTWTSKMGCPSFSLPGGPADKGGTCPAASKEAVERDGSYVEHHEPLRGQYTCDVCYTGKNNYLMYRMVSMAQMVRHRWILRELRRGPSNLVDMFVRAIAALDDPEVRSTLAHVQVSPDYFRVHDAGDLLTIEYYLVWREVAYRLPGVHFWLPTRQWVWPKWRVLFENYPPPPNLSVRPSSLFFGATPPMLPGLSAGTTAMPATEQEWYRFGDMDVWNCPAYKADLHSCPTGINPDGQQGCRACWDRQGVPVNYRAH